VVVFRVPEVVMFGVPEVVVVVVVFRVPEVVMFGCLGWEWWWCSRCQRSFVCLPIRFRFPSMLS